LRIASPDSVSKYVDRGEVHLKDVDHQWLKSEPADRVAPNPWEVLIVDDDEDIHLITAKVLSTFVFEKRALKLYHASSCEEALEKLQEYPNVALMLADVCMEKEDSGLELVKRTRVELKGHPVRIVLRTSKASEMPAKDTILDYDIHHLIGKVELRPNDMFLSIVSALRAYRDLVQIERSRVGFRRLLQASKVLFQHQDASIFAETVLFQMQKLIADQCAPEFNDVLNELRGAWVLTCPTKITMQVLASCGDPLPIQKGYRSIADFSPFFNRLLRRAQRDRRSFFEKKIFVGYLSVDGELNHVIMLQSPMNLGPREKDLIEALLTQVSLALPYAVTEKTED
jgi:CheY-like chemotaxis protein